VNKAALKTMREAGKRYFEDFKNSISCFLLSFLTIRLVGAATIAGDLQVWNLSG